MKKSLLILTFLLLLQLFGHAQPWLKHLPGNGTRNNYTLLEYKQAFDTYWQPYNVQHGYYYKDGKKMKAVGWKQFQRWYYNMESQVDKTNYRLPANTAFQVYSKYKSTLKSSNATSAQWTAMGPNTTPGGYAGLGRVNCVAFHPTDNNTYWIGAASGGLWKTSDNGATWTCLTDNNGVLAVSNIIIPSDYATSNTIYISTGDRDGWDNNSIGVLKSTDGGLTWNITGLTYAIQDGKMVNRLIVHPTSNSTMIAATTDGVYKTTNGGTTWSTKLTAHSFIDLEYKPGDFSVLYGSTSYGEVYVTTDNGATWTLTYSETGASRIELTVTANDPLYVYGLVSDESGGLFKVIKSTDGGVTFATALDGNTLNLLGWEVDGTDSGGQGWYDLSIVASPTNKNIVIVGGVNSWRSTDGGTNWSPITHWWGDGGIQAIHADKHDLKYRADGSLFECNDGGIYISANNGTDFTDKSSGLMISQMYKLGISATNADEVIAGLQDNGTKLFSGSNWLDVKGGDGMECVIDFTDVNVQYGTYTNGQISRTDDHWNTSTEVQPVDAGSGAWVTPYIMDPTDNQTLYAGYADIWKTTDKGNSWTKISDFNSSGKFRSLAIAPSDVTVLYAAEQSNIYVTTDGGANWSDITGTLPTGSSNITYIAVKHDDPNTLWVTMSGYNANRVYESVDGGANWTDISNGLPELPAYTIVQNRQISSEVHLYVGTELGIYFKKGEGNWVEFNNGLPNVRIGEIEIYYNETTPENSMLRAATYGRGMWETPVYFESGPMTYVSSTSTQTDLSTLAPGTTDELILGVEVVTSGSQSPLNLTSMVFNTNGTTDVQDILAAKLYYTGNSTDPDKAVLIATQTSPSGAFTMNFNQAMKSGKNYFWLVYDIATDATIGNFVDAECRNFTLGGTVYNPAIIAPTGKRKIDISYCEATVKDVTYEFISKVVVGSITKSSNIPANGYSDFSALSTDVTIGQNTTVSVTNGDPYNTDQLLIWVDWNKDGDFEDELEDVYVSPMAETTYNATFEIPTIAGLGKTRMRIRLNDTSSGSNSTPCGESGFGEVEDYSLFVLTDNINRNVAVTVNPANSGTVTGNGNYLTGQTVVLNATASSGYAFESWKEADVVLGNSPVLSFFASRNIQISANFIALQYNISASVTPSNGGTVSGGGVFTYNQSATLVATPAEGYHFVNWTLNGTEVSTSASYTFNVTADAAYVANFELNKYTIVVEAYPVEGGTTTGSATYDHGSNVTVTATPAEGYSFVQWFENDSAISSELTYTFVATKNRTLVARFVLSTYEIMVDINPASSGRVEGSGYYEHGETVTLKARPFTDFRFVNWTEGGNEISTDTIYSFTASGNRSLVANFKTTVGLNPEFAKYLELFPNPAKSELFVKGVPSGAKATLLDANGRVIRNVELMSGQIKIDDLPKGMYSLLIELNGERVNKLFYKE